MTKNWTYHEGKALISAYANRKDEYYKTRSKKEFWEKVLSDLESLNALSSPTTAQNCDVKWSSLQRAYKKAKNCDNGKASKFLLMNEMEEIYQDNPNMWLSHTVSVGVECKPIIDDEEEEDTESTILKNGIKMEKSTENYKRKSLQDSYLKIKRKYYDELIKVKKEKNELLKKYLEDKEKSREERNSFIVSLLNK